VLRVRPGFPARAEPPSGRFPPCASVRLYYRRLRLVDVLESLVSKTRHAGMAASSNIPICRVQYPFVTSRSVRYGAGGVPPLFPSQLFFLEYLPPHLARRDLELHWTLFPDPPYGLSRYAFHQTAFLLLRRFAHRTAKTPCPTSLSY